MPPETNLERLRRAFTEVLGEDYDSEIRSLVEGRVWYHAEIGIEEVFNLWVATNVESAADALWIFEPLRVSDRKFLCERFGIQRADIIGKTPKELAEAVLSATGPPILRATGNRIVLANWEHLLALVDNEEDARAAVFARQRAERLLRKILFFYCSTRYGSEFVSMLENPGSLRLHKQLTGELGQTDSTRESRVAKLLTVDGWADLGSWLWRCANIRSVLPRRGQRIFRAHHSFFSQARSMRRSVSSARRCNLTHMTVPRRCSLCGRNSEMRFWRL